MSDISKLTELRKLMLDMERSVGLQDLSSAERDIYYAATELSEAHGGVTTSYLLKHVLVADVSRPTFFRALKSLVSRGYLIQAQETGRGQYLVKSLD
ncbi:hypothetical protein DL239_17970 [Sedimentitalea sp. CY04]|uniref:MarR family transcriptional regulator n=1 Tax=Parasedimentitalea denitrificans TaxID=2211118 RepID=A0ABX0WB21_9RHOB|nr:hypothetical protein [Sedimentitalea sp. CY04]NIZ62860.1 hypothetical protein [Sedimentitalea sp. CY04]